MLKGTRRDKVLVEAGPDGARALDDVLAYRYEDAQPTMVAPLVERMSRNDEVNSL